ncbi:MAG: sigma-70 family RNA polymerase sigma factor [Cyanobacteria bacterium P01_F01_bin.150]
MFVRSSPMDSVASEITDTELVHQLWQGDLGSLGTLYDRYSDFVYTIALRILGDVASAEDLTQDVFLTLSHHRGYSPERGSLSSYLSLLTRSRAIDRIRAQSTRHKYMNEWKHHPQSSQSSRLSPMEHATQQERTTLVKDALTCLTQEQRKALELSYYQGQSQTEIAQHLGVPLGTVKSWMRRGLLKLRSHLQHRLSEDDFKNNDLHKTPLREDQS